MAVRPAADIVSAPAAIAKASGQQRGHRAPAPHAPDQGVILHDTVEYREDGRYPDAADRGHCEIGDTEVRAPDGNDTADYWVPFQKRSNSPPSFRAKG
jgi:hypothetical protein